MKPKRIILVRHGQSIGNVDYDVYANTPDYALNLTDAGHEQAIGAGVEIKKIIGDEICYVYCSPYYRTRQTLEGIRQTVSINESDIHEDPRIREQDWGHLKHPDTGDQISEDRDDYGTFYFRIPDGESGADVYDRVSTFLETLHRDFQKDDFPENALIVTHGLTMRLFLMRWFHWSVEEFENLRNPKNCQVVVMEKTEAGKYKLVTEMETRKMKDARLVRDLPQFERMEHAYELDRSFNEMTRIKHEMRFELKHCVDEATDKALEFATKAHGDDKRRDGKPYITHPVAVAKLLDDALDKVVALLHDTIEDTDVTRDDIDSIFGENVAKTVEVLTHKKGEDYFEYINRIKHHPMATRVKIADLTHNLQDNAREDQVRKYQKALMILKEK
jgi:broad specificity phosphatase PhoE